MSRRPVLTWVLMALCTGVLLLRLRIGWSEPWPVVEFVPAKFALWPFQSPHFRFLQLGAYAFEHGSVAHLALNLLGLWVFGSALESWFGWRRTFAIYMASVLMAGIAQQSMSRWLGPAMPIIGASGGIFGLLVAFARAFPDAEMLVFPIPVPVQARTAALAFATLELAAALPLGWSWSRTMNVLFGNTAHFAHLGGMLGGLLVGPAARPKITAR